MASKLQYWGGATREAEQRWSRGGKGPLLCVLRRGSKGEAASICALRCCLYVLCNGRSSCRGGHSCSFFSPVVVQRELQQFECSSNPLIACVDCGAREPSPKAEVGVLCSFCWHPLQRMFSHRVDDTSLVTGETWLVVAHQTLLLWTKASFLTYWRKAPSPPLANLLIHPSLFLFLCKGNVASSKKRNYMKNTIGTFAAHVSLLAFVSNFKEAFSECRRLSGGRPSLQMHKLERFVHPFGHSCGPNKAVVLSGIALDRVIFVLLLDCFFSIYFIQSLVIYYLPDNSTPIKIYEFVLKPILDYVSVYETSHEPCILQWNLAIAPHNNNKTGHISPFVC